MNEHYKSPLKNDSWTSKLARWYGAVPYGELQQNSHIEGSTSYQVGELRAALHEFFHQIWLPIEKAAAWCLSSKGRTE